jgi:transposase
MNNIKYIGMDVHQATISVAVVSEKGALLLETVLAAQEKCIVEFMQRWSGEVHVTFEEGTWSTWLYELLQPHAERVLVCNPRKIAKRGNKSDKIDARKLAYWLRSGDLSPVYHHDCGVRHLKELSRSYMTLSKDLTRIMNRIKALYRSWGVACAGKSCYGERQRSQWLAKLPQGGVRQRADQLYQHFDAVHPLLQAARKAMLAESKKHMVCARLKKIPYIGPIRATLLIALIQTAHRFRTKRQLWSYAGLGLVTVASGEYEMVQGKPQRHKTPLIRGLNPDCNRDLKYVFKSTANRASGGRGPFHDFYENLLAQGMRADMARLTLARKIAAIVLVLWKKGVDFDPQQLKRQEA